MTGLDIGTGHVRAAQVRSTGSGFSLVSYGLVNMPLGSVVEGEIVDADAVATSIRELWKRSNIKGRDVAIGISNQKVVVRLIDLPFMERADLEGAIQFQAQDYIPIPVEEAILDFHILGDYMTPADEHMMEVMLVAAQRDMVGTAVAAVEGAGLKLVQIDLTAFALVRGLFGDVSQVVPDEISEPGEAIGVIHVSSGLTNIAVVERDVPRFTRVSSVAGNQFTQAIANVLNMTFAEAEELKIGVGLPGVSAQATASVEGIDAYTVQVAQEALTREVGKFVAEVRRSFDYYLTQATQVRTIRSIYMTGAGAALTNLVEHLEQGLQAQVLLADPLSRVVPASAAVESVVMRDRLGCTAAIGLATGGGP